MNIVLNTISNMIDYLFVILVYDYKWLLSVLLKNILDAIFAMLSTQKHLFKKRYLYWTTPSVYNTHSKNSLLSLKNVTMMRLG